MVSEFYQDPTCRLLLGDAREMLAQLPEASVHCAITSPPYWGLRDYKLPPVAWADGWQGCLGLEPTVEMYIAHLVEVFQAVKRVLRDDGCFWLNVGDSYAGSGPGLKPLDLCLIPQRLALALQQDGWWVRSEIIYAKPAPMPESVSGWEWRRCRTKGGGNRRTTQPWAVETGQRDSSGGMPPSDTLWADCPGCPKCIPNGGLVLRRGNWRPTRSHETILMLTKSASYFCDGEQVKEPPTESTLARVSLAASRGAPGVNQPSRDVTLGGDGYKRSSEARISVDRWTDPRDHLVAAPSPTGRNQRDVWIIPPSPFPEAHFATFPEELPRKCILASTSEAGCCPKCGAQVARLIDKPTPPPDVFTLTTKPHDGYVKDDSKDGMVVGTGQKLQDWRDEHPTVTLGFRPTCLCPEAASPIPCTVLDPFVGSGTTCLAAKKLGRRSIGIDLNGEYLKMAKRRVEQVALPLGTEFLYGKGCRPTQEEER